MLEVMVDEEEEKERGSRERRGPVEAWHTCTDGGFRLPRGERRRLDPHFDCKRAGADGQVCGHALVVEQTAAAVEEHFVHR